MGAANVLDIITNDEKVCNVTTTIFESTVQLKTLYSWWKYFSASNVKSIASSSTCTASCYEGNVRMGFGSNFIKNPKPLIKIIERRVCKFVLNLATVTYLVV